MSRFIDVTDGASVADDDDDDDAAAAAAALLNVDDIKRSTPREAPRPG